MKFGPVKKFTVLDDINNILYAINKDFSLNFKCGAMTGKDKGDELKTITFQDWVKSKFAMKELSKYYPGWTIDEFKEVYLAVEGELPKDVK